MPLPVARTRDEAHLYLDLTPCDACGSTETEWQHGQAMIDSELASCYDGVCANCGAEREYFFGLPAQEIAAGNFPTFGGPEPSELLDAGRWLELADQVAGDVPLDDSEAARHTLAIAAAAVAETLKFIPPDLDAVPDQAFWTAEGRRVRDAEPGRFRRDRLMVVLDSYQNAGPKGSVVIE